MTAFPDLQVLVALTTDPLASVPEWTNITAHASHVHCVRGRTGDDEDVQAGSATLTLDNSEDGLTGRPFDSENVSSPYSPLDAMRRVRVGSASVDADIADLFDRADSEPLGTAADGGIEAVWESYDLGSDAWTWSVVDDTAVPERPVVAAGALVWSVAVVESGEVDVTVSADVVRFGVEDAPGDFDRAGIAFRVAADGQQGWMVFVDVDADGVGVSGLVVMAWDMTLGPGSELWFYEAITGTDTFVEGDTVKVVTAGNTIQVFLADVNVWEETHTEYADATKHGLAVVGQGGNPPAVLAALDNFSCITGASRPETIVWDGYATEWPVEHVVTEWDSVDVPCTDILGFLAGWPIEPHHPFILDVDELDGVAVLGGPPELPAQRSGERIRTVLELIGVPDSLVDADDGISMLAADQPTDDVVTYLGRCARSELGRLYVSADGKVTFRERRTTGASEAVFSDQPDVGAGEYGYTGLSIDNASAAHIRNVVRRGRADGPVVEARDAASIAKYGQRDDTQTDLLNESLGELADQATYLVMRDKTPRVQVRGLTVAGEQHDGAVYAECAGREIGDRVTIARTAGGVLTPRDSHIDGVEHDISPPLGASETAWATTWTTSEVDTNVWFILDTDVLNGPALLAF